MDNDQNPIELRQKLEVAEEEIARLRSENTRLKSVLESFSLRTAASLVSTSSQDALLASETTPKTPRPSSASPPVTTKSRATPCDSLSSERKIEIFRSLFRGREDIYAVRWENKAGRSGYSPRVETSGIRCSATSPVRNARIASTSQSAMRRSENILWGRRLSDSTPF